MTADEELINTILRYRNKITSTWTELKNEKFSMTRYPKNFKLTHVVCRDSAHFSCYVKIVKIINFFGRHYNKRMYRTITTNTTFENFVHTIFVCEVFLSQFFFLLHQTCVIGGRMCLFVFSHCGRCASNLRI